MTPPLGARGPALAARERERDTAQHYKRRIHLHRRLRDRSRSQIVGQLIFLFHFFFRCLPDRSRSRIGGHPEMDAAHRVQGSGFRV